MNIVRIGKLIDPTEFQYYVDEAEKLEIYVHKYGTQFKTPEHPCWMEYKNEGKVTGSISFTRNTYKHPVLSEMIQRVINVLTPVFPLTNPPITERVHLIRTLGSIPAHKDEAGRNTCINIGVKNSTGAITRLSNDGVYENFKLNNSSYLIEEGVGYLLNTNQFHSVESTSLEPRYLITYGFGTKFDEMKQLIRIPN